MASFVESLSRFTRSPAFKFFLIGAFVLLLGIPLGLVWLLVSEREDRAAGVRRDVARVWGAEQTISGPFLVVPYAVRTVTTADGKQTEHIAERYAVFLPETFTATGGATSEVRKRGIYEATVYSARLRLEGRFASPDMRLADAAATTVRWNDAFVALGLSDVSGLKESATLIVDGNRRIPFEPSIGLPNHSMPGMNARLFPTSATAGQAPPPFTFAMDLAFNGSSGLNFAPVGRETRVELKSDWRHPSFAGSFLPESRDIGAEGFSAVWRVPHLARSVPQAWSFDAGSSYSANNQLNLFYPHQFGVNFYIPVDYYDLVNRAAKYGLMFLAIAFFGVFVLELMSDKRVHAVQYVFVGLAMILFYILLLSFSEHIGFTAAYFIASTATGGMLSLYVSRALMSRAKGFIMLSVFLILYGLLYLILRLQDYAMLAGAVASFVMLTITMFATLRVNWSGGEAGRLSEPQ